MSTTLEQFISGKIDNLIKWLETMPAVKSNSEAMSKLPSFRDTKWAIWYIEQILPAYRSDPERVLSQIIADCGMKDGDFNKDERHKFGQYLKCFVTAVSTAK